MMGRRDALLLISSIPLGFSGCTTTDSSDKQEGGSQTCSSPPPEYEEIGDLLDFPSFSRRSFVRSPAVRKDEMGLEDSRAISFGAPDGCLYVQVPASWESEAEAKNHGSDIVDWFLKTTERENFLENADDYGVEWKPEDYYTMWVPYGTFSFAVYGKTEEHMRETLVSNPGVSEACFEKLSRDSKSS